MLNNIFPLNIFPEGSLANSVLVTVWLGVLVIAFFNLRFGWGLSGLVVPGYLVPLLLIKPIAVVVIIFEAWITYLVSVFISNKSASWFNLSHFFGRDRFFLLVIISVFVRLLFDGYLLPNLSDYLVQQWQFEFRFQNEFHSFGLIIISLIANQMWKTGLFRGSIHMLVSLGVTYLIVRYVLIELTNFSMANLAFMYEEIAVAILASPKSYIILLVCCYLASRMNLLYGWEYGGILIPSLIALQWYFPQKILVTFLEAFIILILAKLLLKVPRIARMDIAGARKLVFFFTLSFLYKFLLAYGIQWYNPYIKVSDFFAFGYLLSTLIAIKIHDKNLLFHTSRATLQTSISAVVIATAIGFMMTKVDFSSEYKNIQLESEEHIISIEGELDSWLLNKKIEIFAVKNSNKIIQANIKQTDLFVNAINEFNEYILSDNRLHLNKALVLFSGIDFKVYQKNQHYFIYSDTNKAWGLYAFNKDPNSARMLVSAPRGIDESLAYESSYGLFKEFNAQYMAISTSPFKKNNDRSSDDLINPNTFFAYFQKILSNNSVLQIRSTKRKVAIVAQEFSHLVKEDRSAYIWINGQLPNGLNLKRLKELTSLPEIIWGKPDFANHLRSSSRTGFAEILIGQKDAIKLRVLAGEDLKEVKSLELNLSIEGFLSELILDEKNSLANKYSNLYQKPQPYEILFFYDQLIEPLLKLAQYEYIDNKWSKQAEESLKNLNKLSWIFNYSITRYRYIRNNRDYLIISENNTANNDKIKRYWGTYVIALGPTNNHIVEIPRPMMELGTFEFGTYLFSKLNAKALLIAGSHPFANDDNSSDVLNVNNKENIFNLMHFALFRHYKNSQFEANIIRGMGYDLALEFPNADVLLTQEDNFKNSQQRDENLIQLQNELKNVGLNAINVDQQRNKGIAIALNSGFNNATSQLRYQKDKNIVSVWVSPELNETLKQNEELWLNNKHFRALNLKVEKNDLVTHLPKLSTSNSQLDATFIKLINDYILTDNISYLYKAYLNDNYQLQVQFDTDTKQSFLLILNKTSDLLAIRNLNALNDKKSTQPLSETAILNFIENRLAWLLINEKKT